MESAEEVSGVGEAACVATGITVVGTAVGTSVGVDVGFAISTNANERCCEPVGLGSSASASVGVRASAAQAIKTSKRAPTRNENRRPYKARPLDFGGLEVIVIGSPMMAR